MVVLPDPVALRQSGADAARLPGVRPHPDVERLRRVEEEHLGPLAGRSPLRRLRLGEAGEHGRFAPHGLRQVAVDPHLLALHPRHLHGELAFRPAVDGPLGVGGQSRCQDEAGEHKGGE